MTLFKLTTIEKIILIRRRLGLTTLTAAKRWRLHSRTLRAWEQGTNAPSPENLDRLNKIIKRETE